MSVAALLLALLQAPQASERAPDGPERASAHAAASAAGAVWVAGGWRRADGHLDELWRLDPGTGAWSARAPMPTPRAFHALVVLERGGAARLVATGGDGPRAARSAEAYDVARDRWERLAPLATPRDRHAACALDGRVVVLGGMTVDGEGEPVDTASVEALDPTGERWEAWPPLPEPRHGHRAVVLDGELWVVGGYVGFRPTASVVVFDPEARAWRTGPALAAARGFHGAHEVGGRLVVFGGRGAGEAPVEVLEPGASAWSRLPSPPWPRARFADALLAGTIWVVGGEDDRGADPVEPALIAFDPADGAWRRGP